MHVRQYPDSVLRLRANEVADFDEDLRTLVERMKVIMREANGVGLAANQVGVLRRVFVYQVSEEDELIAVVNPVIVPRSEELATDDEGCLSLGPVRVPVERPVDVTLLGRMSPAPNSSSSCPSSPHGSSSTSSTTWTAC